MSWRSRELVVVAMAVGAALTVGVLVNPSIRPTADAPQIRTALETTQALIAATVAYLVYGRVKRSRSLNLLAVVAALGLHSASSLFFVALPSHLDDQLVFVIWAPLVNHLLASFVLAAAALLPDRRLPDTVRQPGVAVVLVTDAALTTAAVVVAVLTSHLPIGLVASDLASNTPDLRAHGLVVAGYLATAALTAAAAYGFCRRAGGRADPLTMSLAIGSVLLAFAWVCFALYPSLDTQIIQTGDALRLGFYLVLLVGAEREIDRYWSREADLAIYDERRRLARDLHDGVAQELAFVATQTTLLVRGHAPEGTEERIAAAAERALDESRRAIIALTLRDDEPLALALARAAEDVAGRVNVEVLVEVSPGVVVSPELRESLVRIVQEAVSNAGRHGQATSVKVHMGDDRVLHIVDDGVGFDPSRRKEGRFGLVSMQERAERLGATLRLESEPGQGTTIEVALP